MTNTQIKIKHQVRVVVLIFELVLYLFGGTLLYIYAGWEILLAVFLLLWANNIATRRNNL